MGISVSQGLRTGANQFFYVDVRDKDSEELAVEPNRTFGIAQLRVPSSYLAPVLRKQAELGDGFRLDASLLTGRALVLHDVALAEDLKNTGEKIRQVGSRLHTMPQELATFVRTVARTNVGTNSEPKWIPELSAVRTNVRNINANDTKSSPRFWYMLPAFAPRHRPIFLWQG